MSPTNAAIRLPDPLAENDDAIILRVIDHDGVEGIPGYATDGALRQPLAACPP